MAGANIKETSSDVKQQLGGFSKRGDGYSILTDSRRTGTYRQGKPERRR